MMSCAQFVKFGFMNGHFSALFLLKMHLAWLCLLSQNQIKVIAKEMFMCDE